MNAFQKRITLRVVGVHVAVVLVLLFSSLLRGCFKPKPKEIITFIDFGAPAPQVTIASVTEMAESEPEPVAPAPEPAPIPEPVKLKPKPVAKPKPKPRVETPKPKPKPKEPEKPKWKPTDPKKIKIGKRVNDAPAPRAISSADIKKALAGISSSSPSVATGNPSQFNAYYGQVMRLFYNHWKPPGSASSATGSTTIRISIRKNGQITKRKKRTGSGDSLYDKTAMDAVNAVSVLPKPPSNYPYDYVEIVFTLEN